MLFLQNNQITALPYSFQNLKSMWFLNVSSNALRSLPSSLCGLTALSSFLHRGNPWEGGSPAPVYAPPEVVVSHCSLAADMLQILNDSDFHDTAVVAGNTVIPAHMAMVHARATRVLADQLFETPLPVRNAASVVCGPDASVRATAWTWVAKPDASPELVGAVLEFLYSGAHEVLDRHPQTRDYVRAPVMALENSLNVEAAALELQEEREHSADLERLLETGDHHDLEIQAGERVFRVHKFILARCPPLKVYECCALPHVRSCSLARAQDADGKLPRSDREDHHFARRGVRRRVCSGDALCVLGQR